MKHDASEQETKKNNILSATFRCISRRGIDGITMRSIAEEANINPALLHYYFKDKENLLAEFIQYLFLRFIVDVEKQLNPADSPEKKLETLFQAGRNFVQRQKDLFIVFIDVWSFCLRNPSLQKTYAGINRRLTEFIENILEEGTKERIFNDVQKDLLSYHIVAFVVGIGTIWHMDNRSIDLDDQFGILTQNLRQIVLKEQAPKIGTD
jgi:AcrR family transcriptional regulator